MTENIELHSYRTSAKDSDIEEYQELNVDIVPDTASPNSSPSTTRTLKDFDFFTEHDVKAQKESKKRKQKKRDKPDNLMEMITTELASVTLPVRENVILKTDFTSDQQNSFLEPPYLARRAQQRRPALLDSEYGWGDKEAIVNLCPVFPKVQKNTAESSHPIDIEYAAPILFNDLVTQYDSEEKYAMKFLDIELKDINFQHHHQFSLERLLCAKLCECYKEYCGIKESLKDLETDIRINRETRDSLKQDLMQVSPDKKDDIRFDQTVRKYTGILLELKEKYLNTLQKQKGIIHKMVILWCDIEMVREKSECITTPYTLMITKEIVDQDLFEKTWADTFHLEYGDMLDKLEFEYINKYLEYKEVKHTQNLDDSAKRKISKPKLQIDEELLKKEVENIVNNLVDREKYGLILKEDVKYKEESKTPTKSPRKTKYFFEIYVDEVFVCESERFSCKNEREFSVEFTESFSVQILPKNSKLTITLNENERAVSSTAVDLSGVKKSFGDSDCAPKKFVYNDIIAPNDMHVGSGHNIKEIASQNKVRLKSSNLFKGNLYTTCEVNLKIGWSEKLVQSQSELVKSSMETGRQIKRLLQDMDRPNTGDLIDIITKIYDKEVSKDEAIVNNLLNICKTELRPEDSFPIDVNSPDIVRLKLLHLRNIGALADIDDKVIPLHASQISTEQLNCLQQNDKEASYLSDKYSEMDPIDLQRHIGMKYVQRLNKNLLKNLNEHLLRKTHKDVVRDFKDLSLRSLFTLPAFTLSSISGSARHQLLTEALARPQQVRVTVLRAYNLPDRSSEDDQPGDEIAGYKVRPLRPFVRATYKGHSARTGTAIGCHATWNQTLSLTTRLAPLSTLHINVFDEQPPSLSPPSPPEGDQWEARERATPACPLWLGAVAVPLRAALTQPELRGIFKVSTPPMLFGYERQTSSREDTHSLIPDVTQLMKKGTTFLALHITTSLSHLGGLQCYSQPNPEDDYLIKHLNEFVTEYTNDFPSRNISLTFIDSSGRNKCVTQFLQPIQMPDYEYFPKNPRRIESALSKSSVLSKSSSSRSSERKREGDAAYQGGEEKESLYSAMSWKNGEDQLSKMMDAAARYVALIPTYEVTESHTVTLLGVELLKVLHGSPLDHTLLLASYFLGLGVRCYVAVGRGLPRGQGAYVLTGCDGARRPIMAADRPRSRGRLPRGAGGGCSWRVHEATTGATCGLRDVGCPLNTVHYVYDCDNIWVNVQSSLDCDSVSFDFTKSSDWRPVVEPLLPLQVFNPSIFVPRPPAPGAAAAAGLYSAPPAAGPLQAALEARIRDKVQRWRPHHKTVWNRYCSSVLRDSLPQWEYWALHPAGPTPAAGQRLKQLMASYKISGCPLNMGYSTPRAALSALKATGLHATADPRAEFALAVDAHAYPGGVVSLWVFLAVITRL